MNDVKVTDQVASVVWARRKDEFVVSGIYGTKTITDHNPVEIGLALLEVITGDFLAPAEPYRVGDVHPSYYPGPDEESFKGE